MPKSERTAQEAREAQEALKAREAAREAREAQGRQDEAAADTVLRQARFAHLPERIRPEDMVIEQPATPHDPARENYDTDDWLKRYAW